MYQGMAASFPLQDTATREDLGMLAVMEALAEDEEVTQRELSLRSGLHLKKVNYCLHKLLEKGQVRFQRVLDSPNKRAYLYVLTPAAAPRSARAVGLPKTVEYSQSYIKQALAAYSPAPVTGTKSAWLDPERGRQ